MGVQPLRRRLVDHRGDRRGHRLDVQAAGRLEPAQRARRPPVRQQAAAAVPPSAPRRRARAASTPYAAAPSYQASGYAAPPAYAAPAAAAPSPAASATRRLHRDAAPAQRAAGPFARSVDVPAPGGTWTLSNAFGDPANARTAIVVAEILGPPVGLR